MLIGFHRARACQRRADEAQSHGLECPRRKTGGSISGPETVTVSRYDGEPGDLRIAHQIIDLLPLDICRAEVGAADLGIGVRWPRLPGHVRGQVLRIGPPVQAPERIAPDLPGCGRSPELLLEPCLLIRA